MSDTPEQPTPQSGPTPPGGQPQPGGPGQPGQPYPGQPQPGGPGQPAAGPTPGQQAPTIGGATTPPAGGGDDRKVSPLLLLLLVVAIAAAAYYFLVADSDDEDPAPAPAPVANTTPATTPDAAATTPDAAPTTPGGDDPTAEQAKTAVRTLVPIVEDCYKRTQDYTQCAADPAVTGAGVPISDDPQPGGLRFKAASPNQYALVAPDAGGRNWVFKKTAGTPSRRTCEQRGETACESKTW